MLKAGAQSVRVESRNNEVNGKPPIGWNLALEGSSLAGVSFQLILQILKTNRVLFCGEGNFQIVRGKCRWPTHCLLPC